jgi:hypothetical protein
MPPRQRRPRLVAGGLVAGAALALHLGIATVVGPMLQGEVAAPPAPASAVVVRRIDAPPAVSTVNEPPAPAPAPPPRGTAATAVAPVPPATGTSSAYHEIEDVDVPATPQPDWNIDADGLARVGVRRLAFEVYVSREGVAERCAILSMDPPLIDARPAIAERLCRTRLSPALRQGQPVPSVRRLELLTPGR